MKVTANAHAGAHFKATRRLGCVSKGRNVNHTWKISLVGCDAMSRSEFAWWVSVLFTGRNPLPGSASTLLCRKQASKVRGDFCFALFRLFVEV